jgi:hypothetical protein
LASATAASVATPTVLAGALVVLATMAVYLATMAPDLYSVDSPELTAAAHSLGIAHAPGYPLYTLAGWLFSHAFPVSTVAFRLNMFSALCGVAACAVTYALALRFTARPLVAASGALALGFSYYFWLDALAAEIYTLDALLFASLLLAALAWRDKPTAARAALVGLMLGLACANRSTSVLVLPALAAFAWLQTAHTPAPGARLAPTFVAAAAGLLAGLSFYLYLPLRSAAGVSFGPGEYALDGTLTVYNLATWSGFWDHVTAAQFQRDAFAYGPVALLTEAATFGSWLAGAFLVVGIPLGLAGIARQWQRDRAGLVLLAGAALPIAIFFINYGAIDKKLMFLPVYVTWSLWMVSGIDWALDIAGAAETPWLAAVALALPAIALAVNWPLVSQHGERSVRRNAEASFAVAAPDSIVYGRFSDIAPMQYLQEIEGQRTDIRLVNNWTVDYPLLVALAEANVGRTPFYLTQQDPRLCARYACAPAGRLWEVRPRSGIVGEADD